MNKRELPSQDHRNLRLSQLLLDPENPRFASTRENGRRISQKELVRLLWTEMAVDEVAYSIAANGYYQEERLLVIPDAVQDNKYIVVEGNRRLAAVILLTNDELRKEIKATDLPRISGSAKDALKELPVSVYPDKRSLWSYLGFRHINGTKPWDAFSKAQYVADVHENFSVALDEVAERIGDRHATVKRLYRGIKVLQQAEEQTEFDVEDRVRNRFYFSHLYTAVDMKEFKRFLGISAKRDLTPAPVPQKRLDELELVMTWLYGRKSTGTEPVVKKQNPDLQVLREVVAKPRAVAVLRQGMSLTQAHNVSLGEHRRFVDSINRAHEELVTAKGTVTNGYRGDEELMELANGIVRLANKLQEEMLTIQEKAKG